MTKKSLSKKSLKSLFSKSEANLDESVEKDGSGGGGRKTFKIKWKKKKKTEPGVDKSEEDKTVSHNELDGGGTGLEKNGANVSNIGDDKKVSIFDTAPRSKKVLLSSSETDLNKPRKFGTFSFDWRKKRKQRGAVLSQSVMGMDTPEEGLEEPQVEPESIDLTPGTEELAANKQVRFKLSEPELSGSQVTPSTPSGPSNQSEPHNAVTNSLDVQDGSGAQDAVPSAPSIMPSRSEMAENSQEVQVCSPSEPAPQTPVRSQPPSDTQSSAASAALSRALSMQHGLAKTPQTVHLQYNPSVANLPDTLTPKWNLSLPNNDLSHPDTSLPTTKLSDIAIPNSELSVAVAPVTDTSLSNSVLPDTVAPVMVKSFTDTDLSNTIVPVIDTSLPDPDPSATIAPVTDTSLPDSGTIAPVTDTSLPDSDTSATIAAVTDTSLSDTDLSTTVAPVTDTSLPDTDLSDTIAPVTDTALPDTDLSDTVAPVTDSSHLDTDLSNTIFPITDTSLPDTDTSDTIAPVADSSLLDTDLSDTIAPVADPSLPDTDLSDTVAPVTDTSLPDTDPSDTVAPVTDTSDTIAPVADSSLLDTDLSDTIAPVADPSLPDTDLSDTVAPVTDTSLPDSDTVAPVTDTFLPDTDLSDTIAPVTDASLPDTDLSDTIAPVTDASLPDTDLSDTIAPVTDTSLPDSDTSATIAPVTDTSLSDTDLSTTVAPVTYTFLPDTDTSDTIAPVADSSLLDTDLSDTIAPVADPSLPDTDLSDTVAPVTDTFLPDTDLSDTIAPVTDASLPDTDLSDTIAPVTDASLPDTDLSDTIAPVTDTSLPDSDTSATIAPVTDTSLSDTDLSTTVAPVSDTSLPDTDTSATSMPKMNPSDTVDPNIDTSVPNSDICGAVASNIDFSPPDITNTDTSLSKTDISEPAIANIDLFLSNTDTSLPSPELSDTVITTYDISLFPNTDLSDAVAPITDTSYLKSDTSGIVALNSELSNSVITEADTSCLDTPLSDVVVTKVDSSQPKAELPDKAMSKVDTGLSDTISPSIDMSLPQTKLSDTIVHNGDDLLLNTDSFNSDCATSNNHIILPEADLRVDSSSPGLSVTENHSLFHPTADVLPHSDYSESNTEHEETTNPTIAFPDRKSDRRESVMQENGELKEAEADGRAEGGEEPLHNAEIIRRGSEEDGAGDVMEVVPRLQQEDQEERGETGKLCEDVVKKGRAQWREEREEERVEGKQNLEKEVAVEGQDWTKSANMLKEEKEGERGVQEEDLEVIWQKEQVKEEMEKVKQHPQVPAIEPDVPAWQECRPQECGPPPPSPKTERVGPLLNWSMATEKRPSVRSSEEATPEGEEHRTTNTNTVSAHTLPDTGTEREHTLADTGTEREEPTHTPSLSYATAGTEDPLPSLLSLTTAEQFLDDLSGPLAAVEESVNTWAQEDLDIMNSGYGILSTTLNTKPTLTQEIKEDGRQRCHKVSLVSGYDDHTEDLQSSPGAGQKDADPAVTEKRSEVHSLQRYIPGDVTSSSTLRPDSEHRSSPYLYRSSYLDTQHFPSPGTHQEAGLSAVSLEEPRSHGNSQLLSERSEVHFSREPDPGGRDWVESAAPAEERARKGGINSGLDSQWLADGRLSPTQSEEPFSGVFKATRVELLPSPTSPDLGSPNNMDSLVDTLKSMDRPQRQRGTRSGPFATISSLAPIVEDAPTLAVKTPERQGALNGISSLGLKRSSPIKTQQDLEGADQHSRGLFLPVRASDSSIIFRKSSSTSLSVEGTSSTQLNGGTAQSPSRLDNSMLFSSYRTENLKSPAQRPLLRASSLPDSSPAMDRLSIARAQPVADPPKRATSVYERISFTMPPPSSVPERVESLRISRPPSLAQNPPREIASSPLDLIRSPPADPLSKFGFQRSLSADVSLGSQAFNDINHGSHFTPEPEKSAVNKYRAFPDAYLTKEKDHGKLNPRPGKMVIYHQPGFSGDRIEIRNDVIDATPWELPETISIRVVRGGWVLYEKPHYRGEKIALDEGDIELTYPFGSPEEDPKTLDEQEVKPQTDRKFIIGSMRRAVRDYSVPEISLFPEENAEGKKVVFRDTSEDARIFGFPIKANSIIINAGLWLVYAHPFMEGVPRVLEVGGYPKPSAWGVDKPYVGSLHPLKIGEPKVEKPNEPKVIIYDKPYFTGKSREIFTHVRDFITRTDQTQTAFMHDLGSIKVVGGCWVGFSKVNFRGHQYLFEEGEYHDWRVWGGVTYDLRSLHLIRADFSEPMLVMFGQPDDEDEEEEQTFEVTEAIPDVELYGFRTSTRSIHVLSGAWIAYSHVDFSGNQYILEKGFYSNSGDWGATDNRICSLQPILSASTENSPVRSQILLFSEPDFQGQCRVYKENQESLPDKFITKSCRVLEGSWVVYEEYTFLGNLYVLSEGDYPSLTSMGCPPGCFLHSVKSIPLMFAVPSISLFGLECFEGREVTLDSEVSNLLEEGFNNHVLSVRVNSGCWVLCEHINKRGRQLLLEPIEVPNWLKFSELPTIGSMYPVRQRRHLFRVKNRERGHYMSIQGGMEEMKSSRVVVTEQVEGMSDIWFYQDGLIKNKLAPSMSLQVMGEVEPGSKVVLWAETRKPIQTWSAQSSGTIISLTFQGMALDIKGGKTYDRNHVIILEQNEESPTQQWEIELM